MMDIILETMLKRRIPVTQRNYLALTYFGQKSSPGELQGEEIAELPDGFEDWPEDEWSVN